MLLLLLCCTAQLLTSHRIASPPLSSPQLVPRGDARVSPLVVGTPLGKVPEACGRTGEPSATGVSLGVGDDCIVLYFFFFWRLQKFPTCRRADGPPRSLARCAGGRMDAWAASFSGWNNSFGGFFFYLSSPTLNSYLSQRRTIGKNATVTVYFAWGEIHAPISSRGPICQNGSSTVFVSLWTSVHPNQR